MAEIIGNYARVYGGQGTQEKSMGAFLVDISEQAVNAFERISNGLGYSILDLVNFDPENKLRGNKELGISADPESVQPSVFAIHQGTDVALDEYGVPRPRISLGHSSGQYSALSSLGVGDFLDFIRERGSRMKEVPEYLKVQTGLVFGLSRERVESLIEELRREFYIEGQPFIEESVRNTDKRSVVVVPETPDLWKAFSEGVSSLDGRIRPYYDAAISHFSGLKRLQSELIPAIPDLNDANGDVLSDIYNQSMRKAAEIREAIENHVVTGVDWAANLKNTWGMGIRDYAIIGPSRVMMGMINEVLPDATIHTTDTI